MGLTRALATVLRRGCHLINMSYGEPSALNNDGRFVALAEELVHKHNVTFVSSAVRPRTPPSVGEGLHASALAEARKSRPPMDVSTASRPRGLLK